jgi:CelD/BcsL family acetyltransferase involved in cellulose biosynthesis
VDLAGSEEAVRRFLGLEASSWKGRAGTAMLANPDHARFFEEVCDRFARLGRLQLYELRAGERAVAMKCNLVAGPGIFCFKIGHDGDLARFSPGIQLELVNIERFHAGDADWMDSCAAPDNAMINRLWPDRRRIRTLILGRPGLRTRAARRAFRAAMNRRRSQGSEETAE